MRPEHLRPSPLHVESRWTWEYHAHPGPRTQHWPLDNAERLLTGDTEAAAGSAVVGSWGRPQPAGGCFPSPRRSFFCQQHPGPREQQVVGARELAGIRDAIHTDGDSDLSCKGG